MARIRLRVILLAGLVLASAEVVLGQVATGTPPFGSFGGGPLDTVNLANLNVYFRVGVIAKAGRGIPFPHSLAYNSSVWTPVGVSGSQTWQPDSNWGLIVDTAGAAGYVTYKVTQRTCRIDVYPPQYDIEFAYSNWVYTDFLGVSHAFNITVRDGTCAGTPYSATVQATDGSGFTITADATPSATIKSRSGKVINAPLMSESGAAVVTDSNGNQISVSSTRVFTDSLGTTALSITGTAPNPVSYTYKNAAGTSVSVTIYYTTYTVKTNFGATSGGNPITENGPTSVALVDHITLPNTKQYSFTYEQTPSTPSSGACTPLTGTYQGYCVTARIASVTLPTGGQITYAYSGGSNGIFSDGSTATLTRTTPDGQWTYARTQGRGAASTTTITDPQNNQTVIQFQGIYETQRKAYQGSSTLLQTVNTCYNGSAIPCTDIAVTLPITRRTVILQPDSGTLQSKTDTFYNSYGLVTETDEYDFGSGAPPASPTRKTLITYASLGNGIVDRPATITICTASGSSSSCGGTGTQVAQTTFTYDEGTVTATYGVPQHVAVTRSGGNPTTVQQR